LLTKNETDIDELYSISAIKEVKYDQEENTFYILANKLDGLLGFFVLKVFAKDPTHSKFIIRWKNKLDIGDTNIDVIRNNEKGYKELCISYKTIYVNTYNVLILDMKYETNSILFRHESF
jgi:hypothetical protein